MLPSLFLKTVLPFIFTLLTHVYQQTSVEHKMVLVLALDTTTSISALHATAAEAVCTQLHSKFMNQLPGTCAAALLFDWRACTKLGNTWAGLSLRRRASFEGHGFARRITAPSTSFLNNVPSMKELRSLQAFEYSLLPAIIIAAVLKPTHPLTQTHPLLGALPSAPPIPPNVLFVPPPPFLLCTNLFTRYSWAVVCWLAWSQGVWLQLVNTDCAAYKPRP